MSPIKPTPKDLVNAYNKTIPDLIKPQLRFLFVGINPSLYSGATGWHFARPGNRFWPTLHLAGFTPRQLKPWEQEEVLDLGFGITNVVARATARADELNENEIKAGLKKVEEKILQYQIPITAFLGLGTFQIAFDLKKASIGPQDFEFAGAKVWALPSPSGLNANYNLSGLVNHFKLFGASL